MQPDRQRTIFAKLNNSFFLLDCKYLYKNDMASANQKLIKNTMIKNLTLFGFTFPCWLEILLSRISHSIGKSRAEAELYKKNGCRDKSRELKMKILKIFLVFNL